MPSQNEMLVDGVFIFRCAFQAGRKNIR